MERFQKGKRRYFTKSQKIEILKALNSGYSSSCTELADKHRISPVLIYRWRKAMTKKLNEDKALGCKELISDIEDKDKKIEQLQKALSDSLIETQILKKALQVLKKN